MLTELNISVWITCTPKRQKFQKVFGPLEIRHIKEVNNLNLFTSLDVYRKIRQQLPGICPNQNLKDGLSH